MTCAFTKWFDKTHLSKQVVWNADKPAKMAPPIQEAKLRSTGAATYIVIYISLFSLLFKNIKLLIMQYDKQKLLKIIKNNKE